MFLKDSQPSAQPGCCLSADTQSFQHTVISGGVVSLSVSPAVCCPSEWPTSYLEPKLLLALSGKRPSAQNNKQIVW